MTRYLLGASRILSGDGPSADESAVPALGRKRLGSGWCVSRAHWPAAQPSEQSCGSPYMPYIRLSRPLAPHAGRLPGEWRRASLPPVRQPGAIPESGSGRLGGGAARYYDGGGGSAQGDVRVRMVGPVLLVAVPCALVTAASAAERHGRVASSDGKGALAARASGARRGERAGRHRRGPVDSQRQWSAVPRSGVRRLHRLVSRVAVLRCQTSHSWRPSMTQHTVSQTISSAYSRHRHAL